jgi:hypothetical protein
MPNMTKYLIEFHHPIPLRLLVQNCVSFENLYLKGGENSKGFLLGGLLETYIWS